MKRSCYSRWWPAGLLPLLAFTLLPAGHVAQAETNTVPKKSCCCRALPAESPLSDRSVYQLDSAWKTDSGQTLKLASLRGRPQVVAMFFASCQSACPLLVQEMRQLAATLPSSAQTKAGFVLVSFDPERDTPAALHHYREAQELPASQWTLLTGSPCDVQELALVLGLKYRKEANGQFSHSNLITLLDENGEIAFQQNGLGNGEELSRQLARLLSKTSEAKAPGRITQPAKPVGLVTSRGADQ